MFIIMQPMFHHISTVYKVCGSHYYVKHIEIKVLEIQTVLELSIVIDAAATCIRPLNIRTSKY